MFRRCLIFVSISMLLVCAAMAQTTKTDNAPLVSIGPNVPYCTGPNTVGGPLIPSFGNKGVVNVQYNAQQSRFKVNVSVHDALPNTTYVVDIRCWIFGPKNAIGQLTTNSQGTGTFEIPLSLDKDPAMANF